VELRTRPHPPGQGRGRACTCRMDKYCWASWAVGWVVLVRQMEKQKSLLRLGKSVTLIYCIYQRTAYIKSHTKISSCCSVSLARGFERPNSSWLASEGKKMMERCVKTLRYFRLVVTPLPRTHRRHLSCLKHSKLWLWNAALIFNTICLFIMAVKIISHSLLGLSCSLLLQ